LGDTGPSCCVEIEIARILFGDEKDAAVRFWQPDENTSTTARTALRSVGAEVIEFIRRLPPSIECFT
jgi:hypothetical protein